MTALDEHFPRLGPCRSCSEKGIEQDARHWTVDCIRFDAHVYTVEETAARFGITVAAVRAAIEETP